MMPKPQSNEPSFLFSNALSLVVSNGVLGFWSGSAGTVREFISLNPSQAALLCQFSSAPATARQAAGSIGLDYCQEVRGLVDEFVRLGLLCREEDHDQSAFVRIAHPDADEEETICVVDPDIVDPRTTNGVLAGLLDCGLIGRNVLSSAFTHTQGFGAKFVRSARDPLQQWMPWLEPFFERIFAQSDRLPADIRQSNACYLNALLIPPGHGTGLHVDRSLNGRDSPSWVSVFYLEDGGAVGGKLFLYKNGLPLGYVIPRPGMLIHFRGDIDHGVSRTSPSSGRRSSLVCEHYRLSGEAAENCPYIEILNN